MTNKKLNKKLEADLFSAQPETVISALNSLKNEGNVHYLPHLFELLNSTPGEKVEDEIIKLLNQLKVSEAATVIADALTQSKYKPIRKTLATACWQNGLDYKDHFLVFLDLVIEEDWETGFEAFTVIDNMDNYPTGEVVEQASDRIHQALKNAGEQKKYFLHEILKMLR
ncbi:MAG: hypothetical protein ACQETJ_07990 [Bacteroidota bacterium]